MNFKTGSIIVGFALIACLMVFQATRQGTMSVHMPSDLAKPEASATRLNRIRVAGKVADGSIEYTVQPKIMLRFRVGNPAQAPHHEEMVEGKDLGSAATIPVVYYGLKPDMFAVGRDVIIDGDFNDGVFTATRLLTQCPSKYEPAKPGAPEKEM